MNESKSKYFNTAVKMDKAFLERIRERIDEGKRDVFYISFI